MFTQNKLITLGVWVGLFVMLVGCKSVVTEELAPNYQLDAKSNQGVIAMTVVRTGNPSWELGSVVLRSLDSDKVLEVSLTDLLDVQKDDDKFMGKVQVFSVPAGNYEFERYRLASNQTGHIPIRRQFKVEAGKVNYLGNMNVFLKLEGSHRGTINFLFSNQLKRDFPMIQERYPQFKEGDVAIQLPRQRRS